MARKKKKQTKREQLEELDERDGRLGLSEATMYAVLSIVFFVIALCLMLAAFGKAGIAGEFVYNNLTRLLGVGYYLLPILMLLLARSYFRSIKTNIALTNI